MKILVTYQIPRDPFLNLPRAWEIVFPEEGKECFTEEEIIERVGDCEVLLSIFSRPVSNAVIDAGKKLRLISNFGVGFNNIDIAYARSKNIAVTNTPVSVCNPTAEHAMALMLAVSRRVGECNITLRTKKEAIWGTMRNLGHTLEGKTLGIVGMGRIGQNVAKKAEAFGMKIVYTNSKTEVPGYKRLPLEDLLRTSDVVSLHVPLTPETKGLIGKAELALMRPQAILVNTSRGAVVDETALADHLEAGYLFGAGLDVFEKEPHIEPRLYTMPNVVLTPHVGNGTYEARVATGVEALDNILAFFAGAPTNVVNF